MAATNLSLNLTVDKSNNRVLFAEADTDFVDVLLSFLTLPLGTLVSLTNKNSIPCLDNLYKSVEGLSDKYFQSAHCREMLLKPNHAAEYECLDLPLNVEGDRALTYYICSKKNCYNELSSYANVLCSCGSEMSRKVEIVRASGKKDRNEGVFMKILTPFAITDNFTIAPLSTQAALHCFSGRNSRSVVERQVNITAILQQSLISDAVLTNVFLARENDIHVGKKNSGFALASCNKSCSGPSQDTVTIKLIVDKHENKVIYAECKQDFIDILFSFLAYPFGFVVKSLNGKSHATCFDNLYGSVLNQPMADCFKTNERKNLLVNPKLPSHFRLSQSLIKSDGVKQKDLYMCSNPNCDSNVVSLELYRPCKCTSSTSKWMSITDPRRASSGSIHRGFVSEATYVVTDDLVVTPVCSLSTLMRMMAIAREGIEEIPVKIGEREVLRLLEATIGSQSALTDAFLVKENNVDAEII